MPLRNCGAGATYLRNVTDTLQTVHYYSDSQCTTATILSRALTMRLVACRALLYSTMTFYTVHVLFLSSMFLKVCCINNKKINKDVQSAS